MIWHKPSAFSLMALIIVLLPPASEGWGKVIFSVCSHLPGGGVPRPRSMGRCGTAFQVWMVGGYLGYPPGQVWMVGVGGGTWGTPLARSGWGYPPPFRSGWWGGTQFIPQPGLDGISSPPARSGWLGGTCGTPPTNRTGWGTPTH